ncbi:alpha/beta hydrolase [Streptomyces sp. NPDC002054]|uniref:alpha/beta fold hydrolase n=1 Tax=Streptomyces sp. NPDC002054 TaxID=3154663 RepID=UPI00332BA460
MRITSSDGVTIAFETVGCGDPLVLLHGFFGDRTTWHSAGHVDALADGFRLVLIDARGHGDSDAPHDAGSYAISRQVDDVLAVLDALDIDRAAMWGASMGGIIGLHLLAGYPERLTTLVAGGAHAGPVAVVDPAEVEQEAEAFRTQGTAPFIERLERQGPLPGWMCTVMQAADPNALAALTLALDNRGSVLDALASSPVPLLLIAGDRDRQLPAIRQTAARMRSATLVELPDCGHFDAFLRTDLTLPVVQTFLTGQNAPRATQTST